MGGWELHGIFRSCAIMWFSRAVLQNGSRRVEAEWNKIGRDSRAHRMHVGMYESTRKWQDDRSIANH
jgi:hypothetical protein